MAKLTKDELIEAFKEMTLIELSEFVKEFEEVFDVTAAAPVAVAAAAAPGAAAAAEEEKDEFDVIIEDAGAKKIGVIKAVRELVSSLGLKPRNWLNPLLRLSSKAPTRKTPRLPRLSWKKLALRLPSSNPYTCATPIVIGGGYFLLDDAHGCPSQDREEPRRCPDQPTVEK